MTNFFPELIRTNIPFLILILIAIISAAVAYWVYRRTIPPVSQLRKSILGFLRGLSIFFTILLLLGPTLYLTFIKSDPLSIAVYIDNSGSMSAENLTENRHQQTDSLKAVLKSTLGNNDTFWYTFNNTVSPLVTDTIPRTSASTNFEALIHSLRKYKPDHAIIVSDGIVTEGKYRFEDLGLPDARIHTVGVGKDVAQQDLFILDILSPPSAYLNERQEVRVQIGNRGLSKVTTMLKLFHNDILLDSKIITIETEGTEQIIPFQIVPTELGLQSYRVVMNIVEGERNTVNNTHTFVLNVLKSKIRIAVFSGSPSFEAKFLELLLSADPDYIVHSYIENTAGTFINQTITSFLDSMDVLVMEGFPGDYTRDGTITRLLDGIRRNKPGVMLFVNEHTNWTKMQKFKDVLPFKLPSRTVTVQGDLDIALAGRIQLHPVLQVFDDVDRVTTFWSKIPPLQKAFQWNADKKDLTILVEGVRGDRTIPILMIYEDRSEKFAVFNGIPFWRWHFSLQNENVIADGYKHLLSHLVRWVAHTETVKPFVLKSSSRVINLGEKALITAYLNDAENKPVTDGTVTLEAEWEEQRFQLDVRSDSTGNYSAEFWPPGTGSFTIEGKGSRNGMLLGSDQLKIEVIPFDKEFVRLGQDTDFLMRLANRYNGIHVNHDNIHPLVAAVSDKPRFVTEEQEIEIWYRPAMLFLILILITLEWIIRKRSGLV